MGELFLIVMFPHWIYSGLRLKAAMTCAATPCEANGSWHFITSLMKLDLMFVIVDQPHNVNFLLIWLLCSINICKCAQLKLYSSSSMLTYGQILAKLRVVILHFIKYIVLIVVVLCVVSCVPKRVDTGGRPLVLVTTGMIADIVKNVGGDFVVVESLMTQGLDPHSHKASERDIIKLSDADLILYNGLSLEGKLGAVLARAQGSIPSHAVAEYILQSPILQSSLIKISDTEFDPHIWFDPVLWTHAVNRVADSLVEIDPANTIYYRKNEDAYIQQLILLDERIREKLNTIPSNMRMLVTSHNAFAYFGRAYSWEVIGIQGVSTIDESSVQDIQAIADTVTARHIRCIFPEASVSTRSVDAIVALANAQGSRLRAGSQLYSDSLSADNATTGTYVGMMEYNVDAIMLGLKNE
jgi:manganese/zinc/iron transport system substrate-binding protein